MTYESVLNQSRRKRSGNWSVTMAWQQVDQSFEVFTDVRNVSEPEAFDAMIAYERFYEGTGRTFSCIQEGSK